jgi:hypothetical protein
VYTLFQSSDTASVATEQESEVVESSPNSIVRTGESEQGVTSLKALISRGENLVCDFTDTSDEVAQSEGTLFIAGENFKVRSKYLSPETGELDSSLIFKDEVVYAWGTSPTGETFGFTFPTTQRDVVENDNTSQMSEGSVSLAEEIVFECRTWEVNEAEFVPPADIEFFDPTAMFAPAGL